MQNEYGLYGWIKVTEAERVMSVRTDTEENQSVG